MQKWKQKSLKMWGVARAYRTSDDPLPGIGTASELIVGKSPYTNGSELQNLETACWGHACASLNIAGVLQVLTEAEFNAAKVAEHEARKPYPSWIGYIDTMTWAAPVARPANDVMNGGNVRYQWDEATTSWVERT